jgi:hypothetical protein
VQQLPNLEKVAAVVEKSCHVPQQEGRPEMDALPKAARTWIDY